MSQYQIIVGNVGTAYDGDDGAAADAIFREYVRASCDGIGRAAGESVTMMDGGEIVREHVGALDRGDDQ